MTIASPVDWLFQQLDILRAQHAAEWGCDPRQVRVEYVGLDPTGERAEFLVTGPGTFVMLPDGELDLGLTT